MKNNENRFTWKGKTFEAESKCHSCDIKEECQNNGYEPPACSGNHRKDLLSIVFKEKKLAPKKQTIELTFKKLQTICKSHDTTYNDSNCLKYRRIVNCSIEKCPLFKKAGKG